MGINGFNKFIRENYPKTIKKEWLVSYDNVYIDLNACLHNISYIVSSRQELFTRLEHFIMNIIQHVNPTKNIIFASDGPAPMAKLLLQRSRRLDMSRKKINEETTSLNFTPGTIFMNELEENLKNLVKKIKVLYKTNVILMLDGPNEAEIKVKNYIYKSLKEHNYTHCIVSNDADVIVLSMNLPKIHNIFVMHKTSQSIEFISLGILLDEHTNKFGCSRKPGHDFTVLNVMLGNDYIPKVNFIDFPKLWKSYDFVLKNNKSGLITDDGTVSNIFLIDLMVEIINNTPNHLITKFKIEDYDSSLYNNYLEGLLWCMHLYDTGECNKYDYTYEFRDTPHPNGIILALQNKDRYMKIIENNSKPLCKDLYSLLLIPKCAKKLLDNKYYDLIDSKEFEILYEEEQCKECENLHKELGEINAEYLEDKENDKLKKKITSKSKKLSTHKRTHTKVTPNDIYNIKNTFDKYTLDKL